MKLKAAAGLPCCGLGFATLRTGNPSDPPVIGCDMCLGDILGLQADFTGAGKYLQTDASNVVTLDGAGIVIDTTPCASGVANWYVDDPTQPTYGGTGPYLWNGSAWVSMFVVQLSSWTDFSDPFEFWSSVQPDNGVAIDVDNIIPQYSDDGGGTYADGPLPLTFNQRFAVDPIYANAGFVQGGVRIRFKFTYNTCTFFSHPITEFG